MGFETIMPYLSPRNHQNYEAIPMGFETQIWGRRVMMSLLCTRYRLYLYISIVSIAMFLFYTKVYIPLKELKQIKQDSKQIEQKVEDFDTNNTKFFQKEKWRKYEEIPSSSGTHTITL